MNNWGRWKTFINNYSAAAKTTGGKNVASPSSCTTGKPSWKTGIPSWEAVRRYPNTSARAVSKKAEQRAGKFSCPLDGNKPLPTTQGMNRDHRGKLDFHPYPPSHAHRCGFRGDQLELGLSALPSNNQATSFPWCQWWSRGEQY